MATLETLSQTMMFVDQPAASVARITLNRPEKRNALSNVLRSELFRALEALDEDPDVRVTIIRGAGPCFSAGYDLTIDNTHSRPYSSSGGLGNWARHVTDGCFRIWDMAKPVIAQVHGYCLAGGSELAASCDLVYVAEDAKIGYPPVRSISPPDNQMFPWLMGMRQAMELMLTGDHMSGRHAADFGFANGAFPLDRLEDEVLAIAGRVAKIPTDIQQINKRSVHRQMDAMGIRAGIRAGTEMQALGMETETARRFFAAIQDKGLTGALSERDGTFGDYRTSTPTA